jgi:class 3 adenylate cyclase
MFGAPNILENPCLAAFEAGCDMLRHVERFNAQAAGRGEQPLEIGVGLHAGDAVVGHVGSSTRHDYTAIGDVTNVASRLEGLTKEAGVRLVCSKTVVDHLPQPTELAPLGPMAIKGHTPVEVYGYASARGILESGN